MNDFWNSMIGKAVDQIRNSDLNRTVVWSSHESLKEHVAKTPYIEQLPEETKAGILELFDK